jgi:hypothetical protein
VLDEQELGRLLRDLGERFTWSEPGAGFHRLDTWESRTSMLYKLAPESGTPTVVVKVGKEWDRAKAEEVYHDLAELRALFDGSDVVSLRVPRALGWHDSPPSVCVEYIDGDDLSGVLGRSNGTSSEDVQAAMQACGAALGLFHTAGQGGDQARARRQVADMARKLRVDPSFIDDIDLVHLITRRYGDFAPYNMRVDRSGTIWVLDQPSGRQEAPVHRDVAYFLERVERRLDAGKEALQDRLEDAFLEAYAATGPGPLDAMADRKLIAVYQSYKHLRTARKRIGQRRFAEVPGFARRAMQARRRALRLDPA